MNNNKKKCYSEEKALLDIDISLVQRQEPFKKIVYIK